MAYRELGMVELRELIRRWQGGASVRAIARGTGMDRKTIAQYLRAAHAAGLRVDGAPPTDEQLMAVAATRRPGRPSNVDAPSPELELLRPHAPHIRAWLTEGLRLTKIYRRLRAQGVAVSYSSLYRFARSACDFGAPVITVRVADPPPGEVAEIDFGVLGLWHDPVTRRPRRVYGLLVTLCCLRVSAPMVEVRRAPK
jgi:transposase